MKFFVLVSTIIISFSPTLWAQNDGWIVQTSPTTHDLFGVSFSDSNVWVAVGDTGTILRSTNAGIGWNTISSPVTDALRAVSFHDSIGVAVGIAGRVLRTTDRGLNWIEEQRPTTRALYSVSMGDSMTVITGEEGGIFVSTDDGITWQPHTAGTASILFGVSVYQNVGVGVGGRAAVVMSDNRGAGWGLTILGDPNQLFFYATSFINNITGWAVGSYTPTGSIIIRSDLSGFVWNPQTTPTSEQLFGVCASTIDSVTAVGGNGVIIHTTDGGQLWSLQSSGVTNILNAVSFANPRLGIAVGAGGTILRTTTGGLTSISENPASQIPERFTISQNYPNPFNMSTTIEYALPEQSLVKIEIFDITGRLVAMPANGVQQAGFHKIIWDAGNSSSGTYLYTIQAGDVSDTRKMILLK